MACAAQEVAPPGYLKRSPQQANKGPALPGLCGATNHGCVLLAHAVAAKRLARFPARKQVDDCQQNDRTYQRIQEGRYGDGLVYAAAEYPACYQRADDADHYIQNDAL